MQLPVRYGDSSAEEAGLHENCVQYNSGTDTEYWGRTAVCGGKKYFSQGWEAAACNFTSLALSSERGKAGGHEPPLFHLPGHILPVFSSGSMSHYYFLFRTTTFDSSGKNYFFKCYIKGLLSVIIKNPAASRKKTQPIFSILQKINILCVEFLNCFTIF